MTTKRKRRSGSMGLVALFIAGVVGAGYYFRDCLPSFGIGKGGGGGTEDAAKNEAKPATQAKNTIAIVIKGEQCSLADGPMGDCAQLCASFKDTPAETRFEIDATVGTQATVDVFKKCLDTAGFRNVLARTK